MINKYSILNGAKYFSADTVQIYLVIISTRRIYWISKDGRDRKIELLGFTEISQENIKNLYTSDITFAPTLIENYQFSKVESKGFCVKQGSMSFLHQNLVNLYILYKLDAW